jgi:hypothetical protein
VRFLVLPAALLCLTFLAGCEMLPTRVTDRFVPIEPQEREIEAERPVVFQAVQLAFKKIGFRVDRALEAQGIVVARSGLRSDDAFVGVRQYEFDIKLRDFGDGVTKLSVRLHEQIEGEVKAGATSQVLRDHGLYDSFYTALDEALKEGADAPAPAAK